MGRDMMKEYDLKRMLNDRDVLDQMIKELLEKDVLKRQSQDLEEIRGHILKADHNLRFVSENIKLGFFDWAINGCYYACYHAALGLILAKGYSSKNHLATLCILIKEFYKKGLDIKDIEALSDFIEYQDLLFYIESKNKREDAAYSTKTKFEKKEAEQLRMKAALLISKFKSILERYISE